MFFDQNTVEKLLLTLLHDEVLLGQVTVVLLERFNEGVVGSVRHLVVDLHPVQNDFGFWRHLGSEQAVDTFVDGDRLVGEEGIGMRCLAFARYFDKVFEGLAVVVLFQSEVGDGSLHEVVREPVFIEEHHVLLAFLS